MSATLPIVGTLQPLQGQPGVTLYQNPPFHPNITNLTGTQLSISNLFPDRELYRGLITTRGFGSSKPAYRVNFLYNPSTIFESRGIDENSEILPAAERNPLDPSQYRVGLNGVVGFNLLFDRTYELWDGAYINTDEGTYGVYADVNAFYNLLGINSLNLQSPVSLGSGDGSNPVSSSQKYAMVVQGNMTMTPVDLYFGYKATGALKYFGYISQFDVTYTHFTQKMIPQRCAINIGFTLMSELYSSSSSTQ